MKRNLVVVAVLGMIAVMVAVGAGWWIGGKSEEGYRQALSRIGDQLPGVRVQSESFERGVFESRALTAVHLEEDKVLFEHRISHFPRTSVKVETRFVPSDEIRSVFSEQGLGEVLETPLVTEVDFSGRSHSRYALDAFDHEFKSGSGSFAVQSSGLELVVDLSADLKGGRGRFDWPSLQVAGDGALLKIDGISSRFNSSDEQGLAVGQSRSTLESFRFELDQEPKYAAIAFKGMEVASRNDIAEGLYGAMMRFRADEMLLGAESYGPLGVEIALERLPVGPMRRFQEEIQNINQGGGAELQEAQMRFLMAMGEIIPQLLGEQPRLELKKISMGGQSGALEGSGIITVRQGAVGANLQQQMASLVGNLDISLQRELLQSLIMSGHYLQAERRAGADEELDGRIARTAGSTIETLKSQNILIEDGESLGFHLHFENLQLTLNGKPVPF